MGRLCVGVDGHSAACPRLADAPGPWKSAPGDEDGARTSAPRDGEVRVSSRSRRPGRPRAVPVERRGEGQERTREVPKLRFGRAAQAGGMGFCPDRKMFYV